MASTFTSRMVDAADRLITKFGVTATFVVDGTVTTNPQAGTVSHGTQTSPTATVSFPTRFETRYVNGSTIQEQDMMIMLAAKNLSFIPFLDQSVTIYSVGYVIKHLEKLSGTSSIAWLIGLRN